MKTLSGTYMMAFKLPSDIVSPGELLGVRFEIEQYADWLRQAKAREKVHASRQDEPSLTELTLATIRAWQGSRSVSDDSLDELVKALTDMRLPVLHLALAAVPPPALKKQLVSWVRANCHPTALVDFTADSTLGGGVVIRTPDHLYDHSFRAKLAAGRDNLAKVIANVR